jgi:hypothetical protein
MPWTARAGRPKHLVAALEATVNSYPDEWLVQPQTGEEFPSLAACNDRLRAHALAEGFDIVRHGGGTGAAPAYRFRCFFYGTKTKNTRNLKDRIEVNEEGNITSKRQRKVSNIRQLNCPWQALYSFKSVGKRGSSIKVYILTV